MGQFYFIFKKQARAPGGRESTPQIDREKGRRALSAVGVQADARPAEPPLPGRGAHGSLREGILIFHFFTWGFASLR